MIKFLKRLFCLLSAVVFALNGFTVMAEEQIPTKTVINFDDKAEYPLERSDAMEISLAPERDGKSTKALHILGGEYDADLALNETTICGSPSDNYATQNTDSVFCLPVKAETLYKFTCYAYLKAGGEINYLAVYADANNYFTMHRAEYLNDTPNEWVKIETVFRTLENQTVAGIYFNFDSAPPEMWFDDFSLEQISAGAIAPTDETYCEKQYNIIGFNKLKDISGAINNAKSGVYEIFTEKNQLYTFGFTAENLGENSVFLSFDGTNPINGSADISTFKAQAENRYGYSFCSNEQGFLYVVIDNKDGKLKLSDLQIFKPYYIGTKQAMGYSQNPNKATEEITVATLKTDNPETPLQFWLDNYIFIIVGLAALIVAVVFIIIICKRKGAAKNEK